MYREKKELLKLVGRAFWAWKENPHAIEKLSQRKECEWSWEKSEKETGRINEDLGIIWLNSTDLIIQTRGKSSPPGLCVIENHVSGSSAGSFKKSKVSSILPLFPFPKKNP